MAFSIRSFFGKDKPAEGPVGKTGMAGGPSHVNTVLPTNGSAHLPQQNPFAANMIFKTAQASEAPGQPVSSPFSPAPASSPGLTVGDILSQLPPDVARNTNLSPATPVNLPDEVIDRAVRSGQGSLALFEVYRVCPALFQTPISPQDPRLVSISPHKIAQLLPGLKPMNQSQPAGGGAPNPFGGPAFAPGGNGTSPPGAPAPGVMPSPFAAAAPAPTANPFSPSPIGPAGAQPNPFAPAAPQSGPAPSPFSAALPPPPADAGPGAPQPPAFNPFAPAASVTGTGAPAQPPTAGSPNPFAPPASAEPSPFLPAGPTPAPAALSGATPSPFAPGGGNSFAPPASPFNPPPSFPAPLQERNAEPQEGQVAPSSPNFFGANPFAASPQAPASEAPALQNPFAAAPSPLSSQPPAVVPPVSPSPFGASPPPASFEAPAAADEAAVPASSPFGFPAAPPSAPTTPNPFERIQALNKPPEASAPPSAPAAASPPPSPLGGHPFAQSFEKPMFPTASSGPIEPRPSGTLPPQKHPFEPPSGFEQPKSAFESPQAPSVFDAPATNRESEAPAFAPPASPLFNTAPSSAQPPMFEPLPPPASAPAKPAEKADGERMKMSLSSALKNCPEEDLGVRPDQIPSWVQVSLAVESIRSRLAVGKVVLPVSELIAGLEPEYRNLIQVRPDLQIELPTNELFHALPKIAAEPKAPAPVEGSMPAPAVAPVSFLPPPADPAVPAFAPNFPPPLDISKPVPEEDEAKYDPFAGLPSFPDWKPPTPPVENEAPPAFSPPPLPTAQSFPKAPEARSAFAPLDLPRPSDSPASASPALWQTGAPEAKDHPAVPESADAYLPQQPPAPPRLPEDSPLSLIDDYTPPSLFAEEEEPAAPSDAGLSAFLSKMPVTTPAPLGLTPATAHPAGSHRQLLLRVLFGVQEDLDADTVVRFTASQPGVFSVVCLRDGKVIASSGDGSMEAEQFNQHASQIHQHLTPLIELTGISGAETFSINSQHNVLTFSKQDGMTMAVLHAPEERSLKEKITLIARELAGLIRDEA